MAILKAKIALESRLAAGFPSMQISYPSVQFTPPDNQAYLRCQMVVGKPDDPVIGAKYRRENISFQVFVIAPINKGEADAFTTAVAIADLYKRGTSIQYDANTLVQVFNSPQIAGSTPTTNHIIVPVIIPVTVQVFN